MIVRSLVAVTCLSLTRIYSRYIRSKLVFTQGSQRAGGGDPENGGVD